MKRIALCLTALACLSLTACLDDGTTPQDPEQPGQVGLNQAPDDHADTTETIDPGTSTPVIPHGGQFGDPVQIGGIGSNGTICCVSLKVPAKELPVAGRN